MRAVTEGAVAAVLAAAEVDRSIFLSGVRGRGETASLVGTVTEGLRGALPAGATLVGLACFDGDRDGRFLGDGGFGHGSTL